MATVADLTLATPTAISQVVPIDWLDRLLAAQPAITVQGDARRGWADGLVPWHNPGLRDGEPQREPRLPQPRRRISTRLDAISVLRECAAECGRTPVSTQDHWRTVHRLSCTQVIYDALAATSWTEALRLAGIGGAA